MFASGGGDELSGREYDGLPCRGDDGLLDRGEAASCRSDASAGPVILIEWDTDGATRQRRMCAV